MPINQHQPDYHPSRFDSKIPGIVPRQQINMEGTHHQKKETTYLKTREINWLIGKNSPLSLENKLLIYKTVLKPIWTYGITLWGCASKSNIWVIQQYQSKLLRTITNAPWYVTNQTLHSDLRISYVHSVLQDYIHKHRSALEVHSNPLVEPLLHTTRRLKRCWTFDVINWGVVIGLTPGATTQSTVH